MALSAIQLLLEINKTEIGKIVGRQFLRSACSVGANYRSALRARSKAEFYAKLCIVVEEIDEVCYWLELMTESNISKGKRLNGIYEEATDLLFIFSTSKKTAKNTLN